MTEREKRLLGLLVATALLAGTGILFFNGWQRLQSLRSSVERYESQLARLELVPEEDEAALTTKIEELRARVRDAEAAGERGAPGETMAVFGKKVRSLLETEGIETTRYNIVKTESGEFVEFTARGRPSAFLRFLSAARDDERQWFFPFLSLRMDAEGRAELVFRIGDGK